MDANRPTTTPWILPTVLPPAPKFPSTKQPRNTPILSRDHPTVTGFLDETGSISNDRIFGVGLLMLRPASPLLRRIQKFRDKHHFYSEIKFFEVKGLQLDLYKRLVDEVFSVIPKIEFYCYIADRNIADPIVRWVTPWEAYLKLAEQLVIASIHPTELVALMADNYSTPDNVLFEEDLYSNVNRRLNRLALVSVVRLDSESSDGLQIADLLTSAIAFEFRAEAGLGSTDSAKGQLSQYVRNALGTQSCLGGWRNATHSIQVYEDLRFSAGLV